MYVVRLRRVIEASAAALLARSSRDGGDKNAVTKTNNGHEGSSHAYARRFRAMVQG